MDIYYQYGISGSKELLADAGETMMPAAKKMIDIYNIKDTCIDTKELLKVRGQLPNY